MEQNFVTRVLKKENVEISGVNGISRGDQEKIM